MTVTARIAVAVRMIMRVVMVTVGVFVLCVCFFTHAVRSVARSG